MTISVIIPVFKVEQYIRRCLESVIDQENDRYKIECLIVDDCSLDSSMIIVDDIIKNYHGTTIDFKIISHDRNKGLSEARNSGIKASTGDYLFSSILTMLSLKTHSSVISHIFMIIRL